MKLLIIDDHLIVREGVRRLLASHRDIDVHDIASAREALAQYRRLQPDIVLLDLNFPNASGLELLRRMMSEDKNARILIFSMHSEPLYVARALDLGARGYISKSSGASELISAIQKVAAGGRYVEHEIAAQAVLSRYGSGNLLAQLTAREADIVRQLGEGKTLGMIAAALGVTYKTIANSCSIIKAKLGAERVTDLIRLATELHKS